MTEKWISISESSTLLQMSPRNVRYKAENGEYIHRYTAGKGRGGKKLEILLSSLPEAAQAKYYNLEPVKEQESLEKYTCKQQTAANNKAWVVELYQKRNRGMKAEDFVKWYNEEYGASITKEDIYRWQRKLKDGGTAALVDRRGGYTKGQSSIPPEAWEYFYALYMTQQKRGIKLCYDFTKKEFPDIPSIYSFQRRVKQIDYRALLFYREGKEAFENSLPYMERCRLDIHSNDIWFSDHHRMDVFTQNEDGTRICRMWLTVFFDARSGKIISHICRNASPNATVIKKCFKQGIEKHGIPNEVYFDNGADYRSKCFSEDYPLSLIHQIGIHTIYATPYHGQAKPVERFFNTLEERFGKMFPTYTGRDAKKRPEQMMISNEKILTFAVSMEKFNEYLDQFIQEYNQTGSRGNDMEGKSPDEIYYRELVSKREIKNRKALNILCGTFETRTVQRNGIAFKNRNYDNSDFINYYKKKVIINYDPDNIDELHVFDEHMRYIGLAVARVRTPCRHTSEEDYIKAQKEKKLHRKLIRDMKPVRDLDTMQLIAKNQLAEKQYLDQKNSASIEQIVPAFSMETLCKGKEERFQEERGEDIFAMLTKKYEAERKLKTGGF